MIARALMIAKMYTTFDLRVLRHNYAVEANATIDAWDEILDKRFGQIKPALNGEWHLREYILSGEMKKARSNPADDLGFP